MQDSVVTAHSVGAGVGDAGLRPIADRGYNILAGITDPGYNQHLGDVVRVSGRGKFVCDCIDFFIFLRPLDHSVNETGTVRSKNPRDADDEMPILHGKYILLSCQLRFAVNADRICGIAFDIGFAFSAIKYVIGAEMNESRAFVPANFGENARRFRINQKGLVALRLAKIDIGKRSSIDKQIETRRPQFLVQLIEIREIQLCVIKTNDVESFSIFAHERGAKPPAGAQNYNFHSSAAALHERRCVFSIGGSWTAATVNIVPSA